MIEPLYPRERASWLLRLRVALLPRTARHRGQILPPSHLRFCGRELASHENFLSSGENDVDRLVEHCGLSLESRVLDIGCGTGRLPIGLLSRFGGLRQYVGIDVNGPAIQWCRRFIEARHEGFTFQWVDVVNERYNPEGGAVDESFRLPFEDGSFDVVFLYAIFPHLVTTEVEIYLREIRRVLDQKGWVVATSFVEDGVPPMTVNPEDYKRPWSGPVNCIRYERTFFDSLIERAGLQVERFDFAEGMDGQSYYWMRVRHS